MGQQFPTKCVVFWEYSNPHSDHSSFVYTIYIYLYIYIFLFLSFFFSSLPPLDTYNKEITTAFNSSLSFFFALTTIIIIYLFNYLITIYYMPNFYLLFSQFFSLVQEIDNQINQSITLTFMLLK